VIIKILPCRPAFDIDFYKQSASRLLKSIGVRVKIVSTRGHRKMNILRFIF